MSELELLNLARDSGQTTSSYFAQVITITFAMVIAIYYFLHQAGIRMKIFAYILYTFGMFAYFGMMLLQSQIGFGARQALRAIPASAQSLPTLKYLGVEGSPVGVIATTLFNLLFWILWIGVGYFLFFWRKPAEIVRTQ